MVPDGDTASGDVWHFGDRPSDRSRRPDVQQAPKRRTNGRRKGLGANVSTCVRSIDHDALSIDHTHVKADVIDGIRAAAEEHQVTRGQDGPGSQFRRGVVLFLRHSGE